MHYHAVLEGVAARFEWHEKVVKLTTEFAAIKAEKTITNLALKKQSQICLHRNTATTGKSKFAAMCKFNVTTKMTNL